MAFNLEDKVSYEELSPSLQAMIKNSVDQNQFNDLISDLNQIINNLNGIRVNVVTSTSTISNPQNDKDLAIIVNTNNKYCYMAIYTGGQWKRIHAVYA